MPCHGGGYEGCSARHYSLEDERKICEARWLIGQLANLCKSSEVKIPKRLEDLVDSFNKEQLDHRRGDRRYLVNQIKNAIREIDRKIKKIEEMGGKPGKKLLGYKDELEQALNRSSNLTDDQLMANYWSTEEECVNKLLKTQQRAS